MKRAALKRASILGHAAISKPRKPLRRVGSRAARDREALSHFRETILARCGGVCERCACRVPSIEAHHIVRRSRCAGWPQANDPEVNGLGVCRACHAALTDFPLDVGGPAEGAAKRAHKAFESWRAGA